MDILALSSEFQAQIRRFFKALKQKESKNPGRLAHYCNASTWHSFYHLEGTECLLNE